MYGKGIKMRGKKLLAGLLVGVVLCFILIAGYKHIIRNPIVLTGVLAVATVVLAIVAIWNIKVTQGLLKQSRTIFLLDVIDRMIHEITQPLTDGRIDEFAGSFAGKLAVINRIDQKATKEILEALESWCGEAGGNIKIKCNKFLKKYKEVSKKKEAG